MKCRAALAALCLSLGFCAHANADQYTTIRATLAGQMYTITIDLPTQEVTGDKTYPAVIALHGQIGDGQQMREMTGFDDLGYREGFIAVFPDANKGLDPRQGSCNAKLRDPTTPLSINCRGSMTWLRGQCCSKRLPKDTDQVQFVTELIDLLVRKYKADPNRIYLAGYDEGANLSFRYICEHPEKIAAIAAVGGAEWYVNCKEAARPVPTLYLHGTADRCQPYSSDTICGKCRARYDGQALNEVFEQDQCAPAPEVVSHWLKTNACQPAKKIVTTAGQMSCESWTGCRAGSNFSFCTLNGSSSFWPGGQLGFPECERSGLKKKCSDMMEWLGPVNQDINATKMIWDFFKIRRLNEPRAVSR